jgi:hypothetical protein
LENVRIFIFIPQPLTWLTLSLILAVVTHSLTQPRRRTLSHSQPPSCHSQPSFISISISQSSSLSISNSISISAVPNRSFYWSLSRYNTFIYTGTVLSPGFFVFLPNPRLQIDLGFFFLFRLVLSVVIVLLI